MWRFVTGKASTTRPRGTAKGIRVLLQFSVIRFFDLHLEFYLSFVRIYYSWCESLEDFDSTS